MTAADDRARPRGARLPAIDIARGVALVAMFAYHLTWDFAQFGFIDPNTPFSPGMRVFSHVIACCFLFIAGGSLVLARRSPFDWPAYWRRLAMIALAAGAVSLASWIQFPEGLILFGILHCIAAGSLVALPFLFLPWPAALGAGLLAALAPLLFTTPAFNSAALVWTGLGTIEPASNDFRPLLPWTAALLAGVGIAGFAVPRGAVDLLARIRGDSRLSRALAFGGRHSLIVYLVHQPVFFAILSAAAWVVPAPRVPDHTAFLASCERQCTSYGRPGGQCVRACACTANRMQTLGLWRKLSENRLSAAESNVLSQTAAQCVADLPAD